MGGGDVKILAVAFLWIGLDCALVFAVLMALFAIAYSIAAKFGWAKYQEVGKHKRIPLAPCVAGALIVCFMLGCLRPVSLQPTEPSTLPWIRLLPWAQN
jgi:prepilin signal peptidase PulO-like enzyme (type II secretory pathway)